jgi:hypothetical protein
MDLGNVSEDMGAKLQAILPALGAPHGGSSTDGVPPVDLSIAENELFRGEQLGLIKEAIGDNLQLKVFPHPNMLTSHDARRISKLFTRTGSGVPGRLRGRARTPYVPSTFL